MRKINFIILFSIIIQLLSFGQEIPRSKDLLEVDSYQRRDLSMPMSRILINFFDFNSKLSAYEYSNRNSIPLNVAYLSTEKNEPGNHAITRFSRSITDLITIHKTDKGIDGIIQDSTLGTATKFATEWMPHALPFSAEYENGSLLAGVDFLYDLETIVRKIQFKGDVKNYCFAGNWKGIIKFENNTIVVENNNLRYAISFSSSVIGFRTSHKKWFVALDNTKIKDNKLIISVTFADKHELQTSLIKRAQNPIEQNDVDKALVNREKYWDDFLQKVPHPKSFKLTYVNAKGITPENLRQAYYKAWVFTAQNVLPADKELFPYPQICTGKASLWDEGQVRAPFSAAWESFIGIQLYAYIDPDIAWNAFKGLMSLVEKDGMLGGESLPSRKAQTALILYELNKDKKTLESVYPALKRYLDWRLNITHWIYGDLKPSTNFKDAEFAFSAMVDIEHLIKIATILGHKEDIPVWIKKKNDLGAKSLTWFWETPQSLPIQEYWTDTNVRKDRFTIWITTCLHVKNYLKGDYLTSTIKKFDKDYNTEANFAGFTMPKYPDVSYSVYGLLEHNLIDRAVGTMEANLRDISRGHAAFAEQYTGDDFKPDGVRPSLFGSSIIIDFTLLLNGYMFGDGAPKAVMLPDRKGGVSNLLIKGKKFEFISDPVKKQIKFGTAGNFITIKSSKTIVDLK